MTSYIALVINLVLLRMLSECPNMLRVGLRSHFQRNVGLFSVVARSLCTSLSEMAKKNVFFDIEIGGKSAGRVTFQVSRL